MTEQERQAIRERVNKASPGPWEWEFIEGSVWPDRIVDRDKTLVLESCEAADSDDEAFGLDVIDISDTDMDFIKHAIVDVPKLLDEVERLEAQIEVLRDNMVQALGYTAMCPECKALLPKHADDCELREALGQEADPIDPRD